MSAPKVSNIKHKGDTLTFTLSSTNNSIANALRRVLIAEIPTWAFSSIVIDENLTPFTDEYITHRVGLIPVNNELLKEPKSFKLEAVGPTSGLKKVYSNDITPKDFVMPKILIIELKGTKDKQERVKMTMSVAKGTHMHVDARHSAVTVASYKQINDSTFDFVVENKGLIKMTTLMKLAFDVLIEKLELVRQSIDKPNNTKLLFKSTATDLHKITVYDEDDTLGNLVQTYILRNIPHVEYVAYNRPHPLEKHVIITIRDPNAKEIFRKSLEELIKIFKHIAPAFK